MGWKKAVLVIDVDETLLTIEPLFYLKRFHKDYNKKVGVNVNFFDKEYYLMPRPFAKEFLEKLCADFDLIAWSVADREATREKLQILGLDGYFNHLYGKQDLVSGKKSLSWLSDQLNVPAERIVAVDDRPELYDFRENVIQITPWLVGSDESDAELLKISNLVELKFSKAISSEFEEIKTVIF